MSYQKAPTKIEELGISREDLERKKTTRRRLFLGVGVASLLVFAIMTLMLIKHQNDHDEEQEYIDYDKKFLSSLDFSTNSSVASGCETTLILMRHCEKVGVEVKDHDKNQHCSYLGHERAHYFASLFGKYGWPAPSLLYALSPKREHHYNFREVETLVPLAKKYGLQIQHDFQENEELVEDYFEKVASGKLCGRVSVAAWKHELLGKLALSLSCPDGPRTFPDQFDEIWQLKFVYHVEGTPVYMENNGMEFDERRKLWKTYKVTKPKKMKRWSVYCSVAHQNFDPLKFSHKVGDYDGSLTGGNWFENYGTDL